MGENELSQMKELSVFVIVPLGCWMFGYMLQALWFRSNEDSKREQEFSQKVLQILRSSISFFSFLLGIYIAFEIYRRILEDNNRHLTYNPSEIIYYLFCLRVAWIGLRIVWIVLHQIVDWYKETNPGQFIVDFLTPQKNSFIKWVYGALVAIVIITNQLLLQTLLFVVLSCLSLLAIFFVVASFTFRDSLHNFIAGLYRTYIVRLQVGDFIQVGLLQGELVEMGTFSSLLQHDGEQVLYPNTKLFLDELRILPEEEYTSQRQKLQFEVARDCDLDKLGQNVQESLQILQPPGADRIVLEDVFRIEKFASGVIHFVVYLPNRSSKAKLQFLLGLYKRCQKSAIHLQAAIA